MKRALLALALLALSAVSCGDEEAKLSVNYAPGFVPDGKAISVFGVFKDGRLSPEAWDDVGKRFSAALKSREPCDVAISNGLRVSTPILFGTLDDVARAEGITDELLEKLAPSALGDSILVITISGRTPRSRDAGLGPNMLGDPVTLNQGRMGGGGRRGGVPQTSTGGRPTHQGQPNVFEITASLFSIHEHKAVALVAMSYTGASEDDAYAKFTAKLAASFPGATCRGWNPDVKIDEEAIRKLLQ